VYCRSSLIFSIERELKDQLTSYKTQSELKFAELNQLCERNAQQILIIEQQSEGIGVGLADKVSGDIQKLRQQLLRQKGRLEDLTSQIAGYS